MIRTPLIIGHRGASAHAPENTLAAFRLAIESGADGVEFDVQLSRDGVPVVIHDFNLSRTGGRPEAVSDLTARQLGETDVGSWFNKRLPSRARPEFAEATVPMLEDVLDLFAAAAGPIYVELKCSDAGYVRLAGAVAELLKNSKLLPRVIVKSFRLAVIPEIRHLLPDVQTAALFEPSIMTVLRRRKFIVDMAQEFRAHQISLHRSLATARLAALASESSMPVTVWTADDPRWIARCREHGIGSLITNDPARMVTRRDRS